MTNEVMEAVAGRDMCQISGKTCLGAGVHQRQGCFLRHQQVSPVGPSLTGAQRETRQVWRPAQDMLLQALLGTVPELLI